MTGSPQFFRRRCDATFGSASTTPRRCSAPGGACSTRRSGPTTKPDALEAIARLATAETTIGELGYSVDAQNVLERMGIHKLRELLGVDRVQFRYLAGVGDKVRKEIRLTAKRLAQLRPDLIPGGLRSRAKTSRITGRRVVDELAGLLLPKRPAGDDRVDERAAALYLGLESHDTLPDVAAARRCRPRDRHVAFCRSGCRPSPAGALAQDTGPDGASG